MEEGALQPWSGVSSRRTRGVSLDRLHHHHLLPAEREPSFIDDAELYTGGCRDCLCVDVRDMVLECKEVVYWADTTDSGGGDGD